MTQLLDGKPLNYAINQKYVSIISTPRFVFLPDIEQFVGLRRRYV